MADSPTVRYADPGTARRYPLPTAGEAPWRAGGDGWRLTLPLAALSAGTIVVPSIALPAGGHGRCRWALRQGDDTWTLPGSAATEAVSTHIDCFHVHRPLPRPLLELTVKARYRP
ncbi:MAG: hypothetical protein ACODAC_09655, partial [Pseudomonadota bacterium]